MRLLRGESLVATTNALSALVVDSCTGAGKPTMNAGDNGPPSAFIVATNAVRFPPQLTHYLKRFYHIDF